MIYYAVLILLQTIGCVTSIWFLLVHRPSHWRRIEAIDAMGFPVIVALVFTRGLVLTLLTWPGTPRPMANMVFSVVTLSVVDGLLIVKLLNFKRFIKEDIIKRRLTKGAAHPDMMPVIGDLLPSQEES